MVDELTMGEVGDLLRGWENSPPAAASLATIASVLKQVFCDDSPAPSVRDLTKAAPERKEESGNLADLFSFFPDGQIRTVL